MDKMVHGWDLWAECAFTACARTEVELFQNVLEHGKSVHGLTEFSKEFYDKVRASIQEGYCDLEEELCKSSVCALKD